MMMPPKTTWIIAAFIGIAVCAQAQIVNIERRRIATDTSGWFGQANISFSGSKNTVSVLSLASGLLVEYKTKSGKDLWLIIGDLTLISADKQKFSNAGFAHLRYNRKFGEAVRWEIFTQLQYNSLTHIEHRFLAGSGPRFKLTQYEDAKFYLGIAYMFEQEKLTNPRIFKQDHRISSYFSFTLSPEEKVSFISTLYVQPLLKQFEDYRISNETALTLGITEKLDLSAIFRYSYDSFPPEDVPKSIFSFANSLLVKF